MMKRETDRTVALDDLLRLKRAERPRAEFWSTFDRELRAKQLAALVEKRPWWHRLPRMTLAGSRYRIPLGASAVLALSFLAVRSYRSDPGSAPVAQPAAPVIAQSTPLSIEARPSQLETVGVEAPRVLSAVPEVALSIPQVSEAVDVPATGAGMPTRIDAVERDGPTESPAARYIAANLAVVQSSEPAPRSLLAVASGFESRAMPARNAVEPLHQITPPSETRRSRLLTAMGAATSVDASLRTTERAASRIAEERLYDQVHRFGARGAGVQVKF